MKSTEATLAQLVERLIRNQQVASSILAGGSNSFDSWRMAIKTKFGKWSVHLAR